MCSVLHLGYDRSELVDQCMYEITIINAESQPHLNQYELMFNSWEEKCKVTAGEPCTPRILIV